MYSNRSARVSECLASLGTQRPVTQSTPKAAPVKSEYTLLNERVIQWLAEHKIAVEQSNCTRLTGNLSALPPSIIAECVRKKGEGYNAKKGVWIKEDNVWGIHFYSSWLYFIEALGKVI